MIAKLVVVAILCILIAVSGAAPYLSPPPGLAHRVGLATFQILVAALAGIGILATLLMSSRSGIVWKQFASPSSYRRGVMESLGYVVVAMLAEFLLFFCIEAIGFVAFASNAPLSPSLLDLTEAFRVLMVVVAVGSGVFTVRAFGFIGLEIGTWWSAKR